MPSVEIKNGIIVQVPPASEKDVQLPDGKTVKVYQVSAVAIFTGAKQNKIGPAAVGYGLSQNEAWTKAVEIVKKQLNED